MGKVREVALRMARAFEKFGFFIFEAEELEAVQDVLETTKLSETLRVVRLGDVNLKLKNLEFTSSYYMVSLDLEECVKSCKDNECMKRCVEEKKTAIAKSLREIKEEKKASELSELLKKLKS